MKKPISMKVVVDEIARFQAEGWPKPDTDWYMDDEGPGWAEHMNEETQIPKVPGTLVELDDFECSVEYQGDGEDPTNGDGHSWVKLFRKWKKAQTVTILVVEVPNKKLNSVMAFIKAAGGKVLSK